MFLDTRKQQREHPPIHIDGTAVESFKFLGVHIAGKLKWCTHTDRLKKFGSQTITNFYRCTFESILSGCITAWYGNCTAHKRKALQRVVWSAQRITGGRLPTPQDTYST